MPQFSTREELTMTTDSAKIELTEQDLSRITRGRGKSIEKPLEFLTITMEDIIISMF